MLLNWKAKLAKKHESALEEYEAGMRNNSNIARIQSIKNIRKQSLQLHMDHIHLTFWQFLWGIIFIAPNTNLLWAVNVPYMAIRRWFINRYNLKSFVRPHDPSETAAELILETMLVIGVDN